MRRAPCASFLALVRPRNAVSGVGRGLLRGTDEALYCEFRRPCRRGVTPRVHHDRSPAVHPGVDGATTADDDESGPGGHRAGDRSPAEHGPDGPERDAVAGDGPAAGPRDDEVDDAGVSGPAVHPVDDAELSAGSRGRRAGHGASDGEGNAGRRPAGDGNGPADGAGRTANGAREPGRGPAGNDRRHAADGNEQSPDGRPAAERTADGRPAIRRSDGWPVEPTGDRRSDDQPTDGRPADGKPATRPLESGDGRSLTADG
ncbi:hypothetical protein Htur_1660 [Haloterrigena turkmenica DSM 5511]|uniref:Uncharacterized protein n=1 Tax=Haloterrigena turkmenica (strain ATCC 51198 / DSM 5511 / JCM 9101 / NCIMB 13204 / VKM B-1734 / 4k) TaxID=543526 RepID=D2RRI5_HALTV|nr:hypothetical protein Htur_1660 [Haloterrigena turkmenica DSM 5511]